MSGSATPGYDPSLALPPGFVRQRQYDDALYAAWQANGFQPLTSAQAIAACGTPPAVPTSLPRFSDSNPQPRTGG
jgi:hypothetical protein